MAESLHITAQRNTLGIEACTVPPVRTESAAYSFPYVVFIVINPVFSQEFYVFFFKR